MYSFVIEVVITVDYDHVYLYTRSIQYNICSAYICICIRAVVCGCTTDRESLQEKGIYYAWISLAQSWGRGVSNEDWNIKQCLVKYSLTTAPKLIHIYLKVLLQSMNLPKSTTMSMMWYKVILSGVQFEFNFFSPGLVSLPRLKNPVYTNINSWMWEKKRDSRLSQEH